MPDDDVPTTDRVTVDAVGKATEALEYVERARGHLYAFHQLIGRADFLFEETRSGSATRTPRRGRALWCNLVGRDVLEGRWTFEIVERFDDDYYDTARSRSPPRERAGRGRRHAHEEDLRRRRRTERAAFLERDNADGGPADEDAAPPAPRQIRLVGGCR